MPLRHGDEQPVCVKTRVGLDEIELVEDSTPNYLVNIPAALAGAAAVGFLTLWATGGYWPSS